LVEDWYTNFDRATVGKAKKGTVQVGAVRDRLRLRWSFGGQRHTLYLELPDSITNRRVAEAKAKLIERDMALGAFDATLEKYRSQFEARSTAAVDLYKQFVESKARTVACATCLASIVCE
jgi:integrase